MVEKKQTAANIVKAKIFGKTPEGASINRQFYVKKGTTVDELTELAQIFRQLGAETSIEKIITVDTQEHGFVAAKAN